MKKSFAARRVPRKIGRDDEEDEADGQTSSASGKAVESLVKRPSHLSKRSGKSGLRSTFGADDEYNDQEDEGSGSGITPGKRKPTLNRAAVERNAERKANFRAAALPPSHLPFRAGSDSDRASYSKAALEELKSSTPSTPQPRAADGGDPNDANDTPKARELDIAAKFGPLAAVSHRSTTGSSLIPTEAEIREKKARRARLAQQGDYISLQAGGRNVSSGDDDDDDRPPPSDDEAPSDTEFSRGIIPHRRGDRPKVDKHDKYGQSSSRLARDDEDMAEGFDEFVEDADGGADGRSGGGLTLGKKAEREARRRKLKQMAEMINEAEGANSNDDDDDNDSDDTEAERNAAYEAAQTRAGTYGSRDAGMTEDRDGDKTPPRITPIPEMSSVLARLQTKLEGMEAERDGKIRRLEELRLERREIGEQAGWVQAQLKETGEKYEKLRKEAGLVEDDQTGGTDGDGGQVVVRGLDNIGNLSGSSGVVDGR